MRWITFLLLLLAGQVEADFVGSVVSVHDGDTLTVLVDLRQVRVRLTEIDAPESKQAFGERSRQSLADMCFGKEAKVQDAGQDRYKRTLGRVFCAGRDANAEQVRRGMAWVFDRYVTDSSLYSVQENAKQAKIGLWADRAPEPPWDWRKNQRK